MAQDQAYDSQVSREEHLYYPLPLKGWCMLHQPNILNPLRQAYISFLGLVEKSLPLLHSEFQYDELKESGVEVISYYFLKNSTDRIKIPNICIFLSDSQSLQIVLANKGQIIFSLIADMAVDEEFKQKHNIQPLKLVTFANGLDSLHFGNSTCCQGYTFVIDDPSGPDFSERFIKLINLINMISSGGTIPLSD